MVRCISAKLLLLLTLYYLYLSLKYICRLLCSNKSRMKFKFKNLSFTKTYCIAMLFMVDTPMDDDRQLSPFAIDRLVYSDVILKNI